MVAFVDHVDEICHVNDNKEHGEITNGKVDSGSNTTKLCENIHNVEVLSGALGLREFEEQLDRTFLSLSSISVFSWDVLGVSLFQLWINLDYLLKLIHEGDNKTKEGLVRLLSDVLVLNWSGLQADHWHLLLEQGLLGGFIDLHCWTIRFKVMELLLINDFRSIKIFV